MKPRCLITVPCHPDKRDLYNAAAIHLKTPDGIAGHVRRSLDGLLARARKDGMKEPRTKVI